MRTITLALLLSACGAPAGAPAPAASTSPEVAASPEAPAAGAEPAAAQASVKAPAIAAAVPIAASPVDQVKSGIRLLEAGQTLPDCIDANEGLTYYVIADGEFKACEAGAWTVIDLKGKDGANGLDGSAAAKGDKGDAGEAGANGAAGATGATGSQGAQGAQGIAGANGANGANGTNGAAGAAGATGPTGAQGIAGTSGTNGSNGTNGTNGAAGATGATGTAGGSGFYRQSDSSFVADVIDSGLALFSDGTMVPLDIDGSPGQSLGRKGGMLFSASCGFSNGGCTGTCYVMVPGSTVALDGLLKNMAFYTSNGWLKSTGAETNLGAITLHSYVAQGGACTTGTWAVVGVYTPASTWTPPSGDTFPLGNLYIGQGQ